jgi:hypothetical protein
VANVPERTRQATAPAKVAKPGPVRKH